MCLNLKQHVCKTILHTLAMICAAADLVASKMRLYIFYEVPWHTKMRCIMAPVMGTTTEEVMAPAVADATKLGYEKLYRLLLEHVSY